MNISNILIWLQRHYKKVSFILTSVLVLIAVVMYFLNGDIVWEMVVLIVLGINIIVYRAKKVPGLAVSLCYTLMMAAAMVSILTSAHADEHDADRTD